MGSAGDEPFKGIDGSVGGLVWVRRRNGSWWPGRILSSDELPEGCLPAPRLGTPVKLLGRDDASVDWYNLEKSKRVKAFRCGEYNDCIEKARASSTHPARKAVKYARREHAIIHALELESACLGKDFPIDQCPEDFNNNESNSAPELSQSGVSFEEPKKCLDEKIKEECKSRRNPNNSEDEGFEGGKKRMRGLEDLGMGPGKKKRPRVGPTHEFLRKKNRRRTLSKVLECTPMVCVPVLCEQLSKVSFNKMNNNNNSDGTAIGEVSCENGSLSRNNGDGSSKAKENEISSVVCGGLFDVPLVTEEKQQSAASTASDWQLKGKRNSRTRKTEVNGEQQPEEAATVGPARELRADPKYGPFGPKKIVQQSLYNVKVEVQNGCTRTQHVPYISLMSRLNGRAVTGHPISVEALADGLCDNLLHEWPHKNKSKWRPNRNGPINGLLSKKTRKLSSLMGHDEHEQKPVLEKLNVPPAVACVPLKVVFSRINAAISGSGLTSLRLYLAPPSSDLFSTLQAAEQNPKSPFSSKLIWEIVRKNNSFLVKQFGNGTASVKFSKEPNNLCNLHSYKHSGLANKKTVTIQPGKDQSVLFATTKTKKQNKPSSLLHKSLLKKEFNRMAKAVTNQVADNCYRPDLKKAALARLSRVHRSLKVAKSGVKKRNRQTAY
ncbi:Tudor/PWWP/MBT superfamily protein [Striga asiatica]|uniref:Tudor/PWWP/MBT superfamily protein n=1 Tax=Striga asiatica TaxID=4170 RepID=A0A5A7QRA3_STRAF|nr:Tudor/PWWP/MBT superfamily protein [Striga asiatica]